MSQNKRVVWGKKHPNLPKLNLIHLQKDSWNEFLKNDLEKTIKSISPISDYTSNNWLLELKEIFID